MCNHAHTECPREGRRQVEVPADWGRDLTALKLPLKDIRCSQCGHTWITVGVSKDTPEDIADLRADLMLGRLPKLP